MGEQVKERSFAEKMTACMSELGAIAKDGYNESQRYKFTSAVAVQSKAQKALSREGLYFKKVEYTERRFEPVGFTARSGVEHARVTVDCWIIVTDGKDTAEARAGGAGADPGDKFVAKAQTMAFKYALSALFCAGLGDDPEADVGTDEAANNPQPAPRPKKTAKEKRNPNLNGLIREVLGVSSQADMETFALDHADIIRELNDVETIELWKEATSRRNWINENENRPKGETFTDAQMRAMFQRAKYGEGWEEKVRKQNGESAA